MALLLILVLLVLLDLAAMRSGADSRPSIGDGPSGFMTEHRHSA